MPPMKATNSQMDARAIMAQMQEHTCHVMLGEMRPSHELAGLAGRPEDQMRRELEHWKANGRIFSVVSEGAEYFPLFALNPANDFRPYPAVAAAIGIFAHTELSRWALAAWFIGLNSFLDDQRPMDLLAFDPDSMIQAAKDAVQEMGTRLRR